jgi:hypothetical protein
MAASVPVVIASNQSSIPVTLASTTITGSVAVTGPLTDTQLRASAVPVSGTVAVSNQNTQYAEAITVATATGTVALAKTAANVTKALSLDGSGNLNVNLAAGSISGGNAAASPTGAAVPASADYTGFNQGGNLVGVSSSTPLPVALQNFESVNNTSTTPLGGGAVFTGTADDLLNYAAVSIQVYSDQAGTISIQFSNDGANWDQSEVYTTVASANFNIQAMGEARYFRIVYTNGSVAQSVFRLKVVLKQIPILGEVFSISKVPYSGMDALLTQSVLFGPSTAGGGVFVQPTVTPAGALTVALPTNAATETGNLSAINTSARDQSDILYQILLELKLHTVLLTQGMNIRDDPDRLRSDLSTGVTTLQ